MAKNITLTECNLASLCCTDSEVVYPLTITDQVMLENGMTLTQWINSFNPSGGDTTIVPDYTTGVRLATINSTEVYAPKVSKNTLGVVNDTGIVTIDTNYFGVNNAGKLILNFTWAANSIYGNSTVQLGKLTSMNGDIITPITMPTPSLTYTFNESLITIGFKLGASTMSSIQIPATDIQAMIDSAQSIDDLALSLTGNSLSLINDGTTLSTVTLPSNTYTAGNGISIENNVISVTSTGEVYTAGEGINITNDNEIEQTVATDSELGGIKVGYTGGNTPVQLDDSNRAFVEVNPVVGSMVSSGLSCHYFRLGTDANAVNIPDGYYVPLIVSSSSNLGKRFVMFEIIGREDEPFYYARYILNSRTGGGSGKVTLTCLNHYSYDQSCFKYDEIVAVQDDSSNPQVVTIYRKVHNKTNSMFIVNILAENTSGYSTQHYYHTKRNSSHHETGYGIGNTQELDTGGNIDIQAASDVWLSALSNDAILPDDAMRNFLVTVTAADYVPSTT